jgi:hypothetical protein
MAAITAAAIAGTAITASTIAAGVSTAAAVGGAAMSFSQAGEARAKAADATKAADKAIAEAKSKLDLNFYSALGIQKEPYELQREALLSSGAQAIEAGRESERGAAATAGRIQMAQNEAQAGVRTTMGQELSALEKLTAAENSRLRDVGTQINLEEVAGANLAAANYNSLAGQAETQGMKGLVQGAQTLAQFAPLYMKQKGIDPTTGLPITQGAVVTQGNAGTQGNTGTQDANVVVTQSSTPTGNIVSGAADMKPMSTPAPAPAPTPGTPAPVPGTPAPTPQPNKTASLTDYDPNIDISPFNFPNRATTPEEKQKIFDFNYKLDPITKKYVFKF